MSQPKILLFRSAEVLARIPPEFYRLITEPGMKEIVMAQHDIEPMRSLARENEWTYDEAAGRTILVEMDAQ